MRALRVAASGLLLNLTVAAVQAAPVFRSAPPPSPILAAALLGGPAAQAVGAGGSAVVGLQPPVSRPRQPLMPAPVPPLVRPHQGTDPLPSWREGASKQALLRFVQQALQPGGPGAIPPGDRLAVFDNDGTLWSEQPLYYPFQFCVDRIRTMPAAPAAWNRLEPYASARRGDVQALLAQGSGALATLLEACSSGMDLDSYAADVRRWLATARHPSTGRPYTGMVFQPMLELLRLLQSAGFRTVIVSGGDTEFMRPWTAAVYGIPPEQVIGSRLPLAWQQDPGQPPRLLRVAGSEMVVDGPNKAIAIQQVLGRRPVAAFGNSDGDLQMLEWTTSGTGPRLGLLVHHTDARREWAYDRDSRVGRLSKGLDRAREHGWIVVDMARDWLEIHPRQPVAP